LIRSIWLGLIFLIVLVVLASFKLASAPPRPVAAAEMSLPTEERKFVNGAPDGLPDAAIKGDRLQVSYVSAVAPVAVAPELPSELPMAAPLKIISRHWHEKPVQVAIKKRRELKNEAPVRERMLLLDANDCTSNGLDRIKRLISPTANCKSGS
jgi:hypothetical protein